MLTRRFRLSIAQPLLAYTHWLTFKQATCSLYILKSMIKIYILKVANALALKSLTIIIQNIPLF